MFTGRKIRTPPDVVRRNNVTLNLVVLRSPDLVRAVAFYTRLGLHFTQHRHGQGVEHFAAELQRLELPREDGLLTIGRDEIRATWLGRIFIRNLAMLFDPYLEQQQLNAKPLFSKTL